MAYWLLKSEPESFGIDHLKRKGRDSWDGVRNYQARNFMRDRMRLGDSCFFYHSSCDVPGIVGICEVVREAYPDLSQFNPESKYYDPKSTPEQPRWFMVDVAYVRHLRRTIPLTELKTYPQLADMSVLARGSRLSITPVTEPQWRFILKHE